MISLNFFVVVLIAISLSMDAFSVALSLGTLNISTKCSLLMGACVALFHFFMPIIGAILGNLFITSLHIEGHFLASIIFFYIAILMFKDFKSDEKENININFLGMVIFALGVSLDSFGVGFAMHDLSWKLIISALIFSTSSFLFTFSGLQLGKKLNSLVGRYSILIGGFIMVALAILNLCQFLL